MIGVLMDTPRTAAALEDVRHLGVSMVCAGESPAEAAELLGVSERSVWRWLSAWHRLGDAGLAPEPGRGRPPKLTAEVAAAALSWVDRSPCEFGFATERWTARRVAMLLERDLGVRVNRRYLSGWLRDRGVTPQTPQPVPRERDEAKVAAWVGRRWPLIKKRSGTATRPSPFPTKAASC
jgi:transposase